jgi:hypothetical protein
MSRNIGSMAYHGDPPWHGLGTAVKHRPTSDQMITVAGLNWEVEMRPIVLQGQPPGQKPRKYQLIRKRGVPQNLKFLWPWLARAIVRCKIPRHSSSSTLSLGKMLLYSKQRGR